MNTLASRAIAVAAAALGLAFASTANATWTFAGSSSKDSHNDTLAKTTYNPDNNGSGPSLTISGVYGANAGNCSGTMGSSNASCTANGFASGANWTSQQLTYYSGNGLGMSSDGYVVPNHALDNGPATNSSGYVTGLGNTEGVLLSFSSSVVLGSIGIGYVYNDADVSVFRYTGASAPTLAGGSISSFLTDALGTAGSGWDLVGNYGNLAVDTNNPYNLVNTGNVGSSWWLITAYNSNYGSTSANGNSLGMGAADYFKLYAVAGTACNAGGSQCGHTSTSGAPEPGSLALVSAALLGAFVIRRKSAGGPLAAA
jgi:PEP-CTERM motif